MWALSEGDVRPSPKGNVSPSPEQGVGWVT